MRLIPFAIVAALAVPVPGIGQVVSPLGGTTSVAPSNAPQPSAGPSGADRVPAARRARGLQARFDAANTSHDGKLTREQAEAGHMKRVADNFDAIDAKRNGYVTVEDIRAYTRAQRAARRAARQ